MEIYEINKPRLFRRWWPGGLISLLVLFSLLVWWQLKPPANFPQDTAITIARGLTAVDIVELLEEKNVVRSKFLTYVILRLWHDPSSIKAGSYYFESPLGAFAVADRITRDADQGTLVTLTLPEGYTAAEFAKLASASLSNFDAEEFLNLAKTEEGFLFPDTYYIPADFTASELFALLRATYREKIGALEQALTEHSLGERGVVTLASLLEREANTEESMRIVSGILQKRLEEGMRLQVDASIEYVLDRPLGELKPEDLEMDTPYNTYLYEGLPPTPIGNPGLVSINAVLNPAETSYLYYLTAADGNFYYAETFDEHRENIAKYLK